MCCATLLRVYFTFNNEHETLRFGLSTENGHICIARQEFVLLAARDIFPDSGRKSRDVCRTAGDVGRRRQRAPVNAHFRCCSFCRGASPFIGQGRQAGRQAGAAGRTQSTSQREATYGLSIKIITPVVAVAAEAQIITTGMGFEFLD